MSGAEVVTGECPVCRMSIRLTRRGLLTKHGGYTLPGVVQGNRLLGLPPMRDARVRQCPATGSAPAAPSDRPAPPVSGHPNRTET